MYDCMMMSLQHWSNDMHRLRRSQDEAHLVDPPTKTNRRTGGVSGAPVIVPTLDHSALTVAELIHSKALIDLLWIVSCLSTLSAKMQISSKIIKYQDSNVLLMNRLQRLYCRVWPAAPRFVEAGNRGKETGMNEWINETIQVRPYHLNLIQLKDLCNHVDTVYRYICAGGCSWYLVT